MPAAGLVTRRDDSFTPIGSVQDIIKANLSGKPIAFLCDTTKFSVDGCFTLRSNDQDVYFGQMGNIVRRFDCYGTKHLGMGYLMLKLRKTHTTAINAIFTDQTIKQEFALRMRLATDSELEEIKTACERQEAEYCPVDPSESWGPRPSWMLD
ncbi:MAG: hypothetical protein HZB76_01250 [Chlamydiae bacterium]|nr:hypothetical protein [Chlamydiota bacterium]